MAAIQNERDLLLQGAAIRFIPPAIDPDLIPGYTDALDDIDELQQQVEGIEEGLPALMNNSRNFSIRATGLTFTSTSGATTPSSITLTAVRGADLVGGTVQWTVFAGVATISPSSGASTTVTGSSVSGRSVTVRARLALSGRNYDAFVTLQRLGAIAAEDVINLQTQVTSTLANSRVGGLGALALLNVVDLNSQTVGALNGLTQVTNLGNLAYVNALAANQIGAGTLAVGVVYGGFINAIQVNAGTFTGLNFQTRASSGGNRVLITSATDAIQIWRNGTQVATMGGAGGDGIIDLRSTGSFPAIYCLTTTAASAIIAETHGSFAAIAGFVGSGSASALLGRSNSTSSLSHGIRGESSQVGTSGIVGASNGYDFYAEGQGNYGPFTGSHDILLDPSVDPEPGDILIDGDVIVTRGVADAVLTASLSTESGQSAAIGVLAFVGGMLADSHPAAFVVSRDGQGSPTMCDAWHANKDLYKVAGVNSVGEGLINVCGQNGNIAKGDLIVCSDMPGKGMRQLKDGQPDDVVRSYTVARARADITFDDPGDAHLAPCIYLCG